jgi:hypothetical protein
MFIMALLTLARLWNQLACPSMDKWIFKSVVYAHNVVRLRHKEE